MPGTNYKLANIPIGSNDPIGTYHILFKKKTNDKHHSQKTWWSGMGWICSFLNFLESQKSVGDHWRRGIVSHKHISNDQRDNNE
jgi:hypothetical protein